MSWASPEQKDEVAGLVTNAEPNSSGWARLHCPWCPPGIKKNFYFNPETGWFSCYRCTTQGWLYGPPERPTWEHKHVTAMEGVIGPPEGWEPLTTDPVLPQHVPYMDYLYGRGVWAETVEAAQLGCCRTGEYAGMVVVPIIVHGLMRGWVARAIQGKRYSTPPHFERHRFLFNQDALDGPSDEPIVLVEGVFDALRHWPRAVACLGQPTDEQLELLVAAHRTVIVALDADAQSNTAAFHHRLWMRGVDARAAKLPPGKDPAKLDSDQFAAIVATNYYADFDLQPAPTELELTPVVATEEQDMRITGETETTFTGVVKVLGFDWAFTADLNGKVELQAPIPKFARATVGGITWDATVQGGVITMKSTLDAKGFMVMKALRSLTGGEATASTARDAAPAPEITPLSAAPAPGLRRRKPQAATPTEGQLPDPDVKVDVPSVLASPPAPVVVEVEPPAPIVPLAPRSAPEPAPVDVYNTGLPQEVVSMTSAPEVIKFLVPYAYDELLQKAQDEGRMTEWNVVTDHALRVGKWIYDRAIKLPSFAPPPAVGMEWSPRAVAGYCKRIVAEVHNRHLGVETPA